MQRTCSELLGKVFDFFFILWNHISSTWCWEKPTLQAGPSSLATPGVFATFLCHWKPNVLCCRFQKCLKEGVQKSRWVETGTNPFLHPPFMRCRSNQLISRPDLWQFLCYPTVSRDHVLLLGQNVPPNLLSAVHFKPTTCPNTEMTKRTWKCSVCNSLYFFSDL